MASKHHFLVFHPQLHNAWLSWSRELLRSWGNSVDTIPDSSEITYRELNQCTNPVIWEVNWRESQNQRRKSPWRNLKFVGCVPQRMISVLTLYDLVWVCDSWKWDKTDWRGETCILQDIYFCLISKEISTESCLRQYSLERADGWPNALNSQSRDHSVFTSPAGILLIRAFQ